MKKILFILSICTIVCTSCWKTGSYVNNAQSIFESWRVATQSVLKQNVHMAFIANAWINGDDSVKRAIEDQYFPTLRLRHDGDNEYGLYRGPQLLMLFNTGGKAIDEPGADWLITQHSIDGIYNPQPAYFNVPGHPRLNIRNLGGNEWSVVLDSLTCEGSSSDWLISVPGTATPIDLFATPFTLSGSGAFFYEGSNLYNGSYDPIPITMRYNFRTPMRQKVGSFVNFDNGKVDIVVSKEAYDDLILSAEVDEKGKWDIHYRGTTTSIIP